MRRLVSVTCTDSNALLTFFLTFFPSYLSRDAKENKKRRRRRRRSRRRRRRRRIEEEQPDHTDPSPD
jgi:hypothetical protein